MARTYKADNVSTTQILASEDGFATQVTIPIDSTNADYQRYLAEGGAAILLPADPPPPTMVGHRAQRTRSVTTTNTLTEISRNPVPVNTVASYHVTVWAVAAPDWFVMLFRTSTARGAGSGLVVPQTTTLVRHGSAAALANLVGEVVADGNDLVVRVRGVAGLTIQWAVDADVWMFTP